VASCSNDKKIKIFDIRSGRIIQHYDAHSAPVTCLSYHPSGKYLVSSSLDSTIKIWDSFNSQILYTVHGHQGPVNCVAFSRDGDYICSGGADTILMVWKNNLSGIGYPSKSKFPEDEGLSKPVIIPKRRTKSKTGLRCCKDKNKNNANNSSSMNKYKKEPNNKLKSGKSTLNSKNSNPINKTNIYGANIYNNSSIKSNGMVLNNTNQINNSSSNLFAVLPPEMKITFEKMISQLDLVAKTMKIMDQRIQSLEGQISTLYNRQKKGFVQKQPPQMGDYQYLLENSNNFMPNNSINNNEVSQKINTQNNFDYYTADIYNSQNNFKETMNLNDENKKNVFKTEIDINKMNKSSQKEPDEEDDKYKGQIKEEFGYNGKENQVEEPYNQENYSENGQQSEGGQGEKFYDQEREENMNGEEYEEEGEEYVNEQEYEQEGEEYEQEQGGEEGQLEYDYRDEEINQGNNDTNKSK